MTLTRNLTTKELAQLHGRLSKFEAEHMAMTPLPGEIWKTHPYFEGHVQFSNKGRMRRLPVPRPDGTLNPYGITKPRLLRPSSKKTSPHLPLYARLRMGDRELVKMLSSAVLELFGPEKPSSAHVAMPIDGDHHNLDVENLQWLTQTSHYENYVRPAIERRREALEKEREQDNAEGAATPKTATAAADAAGTTEEKREPFRRPVQRQSSGNLVEGSTRYTGSFLAVGSSLPRLTEEECINARRVVLGKVADGKLDKKDAATIIKALAIGPEEQEEYREAEKSNAKM